jgi:hypothetical protein
MQAYNKKGLTTWFNLQKLAPRPRSQSKHDDAPRLPMVIKGHKLTGVAPVAKPTNAHRHTTNRTN